MTFNKQFITFLKITGNFIKYKLVLIKEHKHDKI